MLFRQKAPMSPAGMIFTSGLHQQSPLKRTSRLSVGFVPIAWTFTSMRPSPPQPLSRLPQGGEAKTITNQVRASGQDRNQTHALPNREGATQHRELSCRSGIGPTPRSLSREGTTLNLKSDSSTGRFFRTE